MMMNCPIDEITDWKAEYAFLLEELIKQAKQMNFLSGRLLEIQKDVKQIISIDRTTLNSLKVAIPKLKEVVENYDGIAGFLSTNVSIRLNQLEDSHPKKSQSKWE